MGKERKGKGNQEGAAQRQGGRQGPGAQGLELIEFYRSLGDEQYAHDHGFQ